jgi:hypothetical protein
MSADLDRDITAALEAEVAGVRAGDDLWERIRASAEAPEAAPRTLRRPNPRLRLLLAAAAAAVVLTTGVALVAVSARDDDSLITGDDSETGAPTTQTTAPTTETTAAPAPAVVPPVAPTSETTVPQFPAGAPAQALGVLRDGRLVRLDLATETIVGEIDRLGSIEDPARPEEGSSQYISSVEVAPDGDTVWVNTCCEPVAGFVHRTSLANWAPLSGPQGLTVDGRAAAVSPDGRFVVTNPYDLVVHDAADGREVFRLPHDAMPWVTGFSWSPDGTRLAVRRSPEPSAALTYSIAMLRWDGSTLTVDSSFGDKPGSTVYWDDTGEAVVIPGDLTQRFHSTSDGRWTVFVDVDGGFHLLDRERHHTILFPGLQFLDADLIG